jgi:hypothetical protein
VSKQPTGSKKPKRKSAKVNAVVEPIELTEESKLILAALGEISPGTQASADFFNEKIPEGNPARVSRASVWNWANGVYRVDEKRLNVWKVIYPPEDTRHQVVLDILALREREAQAFAAHWVGGNTSKVKSQTSALSFDGSTLYHKNQKRNYKK